MYKWICAFLILAIGACKNNQDTKALKTDSTEAIEEIFEEDSSLITTKGVTDWVDKTLKDTNASSKIKLEEFWKDDSLMVSEFIPDPYFYNDYKTVLRWSPDSSYIIDIGSYGSIVSKDSNGKIKLEAGEPDSELALIQPSTQQRTRLMFVGPSSEILDAKWIDKQEVVILGTYANENNTIDTLAWMINVKDKFFRLYNIKSHR